jgi:hypothetical protein
MYTDPKNLIIPDGVLKNGSDVFNILDPDIGGSKTFSVKLIRNSDGMVFWGARTPLEEATFNALTNMTTTEFKTYVDQLAVARGRTPVGSITAFKNALLIDGGDFRSFVEAQGMRLDTTTETV